jgi:hypothetical protein
VNSSNPVRFGNLQWCAAWLKATVVDFYGVALPLCGVILAAEPQLLFGLAWSASVLLLGSPFACAWVAQRLIRSGGALP